VGAPLRVANEARFLRVDSTLFQIPSDDEPGGFVWRQGRVVHAKSGVERLVVSLRAGAGTTFSGCGCRAGEAQIPGRSHARELAVGVFFAKHFNPDFP
jgi:hypothetical protein